MEMGLKKMKRRYRGEARMQVSVLLFPVGYLSFRGRTKVKENIILYYKSRNLRSVSKR